MYNANFSALSLPKKPTNQPTKLLLNVEKQEFKMYYKVYTASVWWYGVLLFYYNNKIKELTESLCVQLCSATVVEILHIPSETFTYSEQIPVCIFRPMIA